MTGFWHRRSVGVYVSSTEITAVALRGVRIEWTRELPRNEDTPLLEQLVAMLQQVPRPSLGRPVVAAGVGPSHSQVRDVGRIASGGDARLVEALVAANVPRFFLQNGTPLRTTRPQWNAAGGAWVAAIDRPVVDDLVEACSRTNMKLVAIAPAAGSLGCALAGADATCIDGRVRLAVRYEGGRLTSYRRTLDAGDPVMPPPAPLRPDLLVLGDAAWKFAPAYAISRTGALAPLGLDPRSYVTRRHAHTPLATAVCVLSLLLSLAMPGLADQRRAAQAARRLEQLAAANAQDVKAARTLEHRTDQLRSLSAFRESARSVTMRLASLTMNIEAPTMLQSLQMDTLGGTLVATTPRAAMLMAMLDSVPEIADARIVGAVTQAPRNPPDARTAASPADASDSPPEHLTVHFTWRRATASRPAVNGARQ